MNPSNFILKVLSHEPEVLKRALEIAFLYQVGATHWGQATDTRALQLIFFWGEPGSSFLGESWRLPKPLKAAAAFEISHGWLAEQKYPDEPDHDGSNTRGFLLQAGEGINNYAIVTIEPAWAEFHK
jgi:hypothetical protein